MWFPTNQFAIEPEFRFSRRSYEDTNSNRSSFLLGGRVSYFLNSYANSTPYILGRFSLYTFDSDDSLFSEEDSSKINIGVGFGYQWHIGSAFVLRTEAQYQGGLPFEDHVGVDNEFSLIIRLGTRFGNNEK